MAEGVRQLVPQTCVHFVYSMHHEYRLAVRRIGFLSPDSTRRLRALWNGQVREGRNVPQWQLQHQIAFQGNRIIELPEDDDALMEGMESMSRRASSSLRLNSGNTVRSNAP
jgi:hypothetical protein